MLTAAVRSIINMFSRPFRRVLWKSLGLTVLLFIAVLAAIEAVIFLLASFSWPWLEAVTAVITGLGLLVSFFYLLGPVTALFAGIFLDQISEIVEINDYPGDPPGRAINTIAGIVASLQFGLLVLSVNLILLPTLFLGIGAILMIVGNAYLLSREYFEMVAMRHLKVEHAKNMRRANAGRIFMAGLVPATLSLIPVANFFVPVFATSYFVHIFKSVSRLTQPEN